MKDLENQLTYIEKLTMDIQNLAIHVNESKNNGYKSIPIDSHLYVIDIVISHLHYIENQFNEYDLKTKNQNKQIDNLLEFLNTHAT